MSVIDYFLPTKAATIQQLGHPAAGIIGWSDPKANVSGEFVTEDTATTFAAVWCAVRVIAETVASLPCILYRRQGEGKERATDDQRYDLVHGDVNDEMTSYTFFETGTHHLTLWGNSYSRIRENAAGDFELELRLPKNITVERPNVNRGLIYKNEELGETLSDRQMLHVRGLSSDGLVGMSVIGKARLSIGEGMAAGRHGAAFYGNGARPGGVLKFPGAKLKKEARDAVRQEWQEQHAGAENAYNIAVLHGGMEYESISMPHTDAQFLESRQFSVTEIARWFRLPPHMLYDLTRSTNNNIEHQGLEFVMYSLTPWQRRWETALNRSLLEPDERRGMFFEFLTDALLRGDQGGRSAAYKAGREGGWLSVNEIRAKENMNPVDGGDEYLTPLNMTPAGQRPEPNVPRSLVREFQKNMSRMLRAIQKRSEEQLASVRSEQALVRKEIEHLGEKLSVSITDSITERLASGKRLAKLKAKVEAAAERAVSRGENFVAWVEDNISDTEQKADLLACADGEAAGFVERVTTCIENWRPE